MATLEVSRDSTLADWKKIAEQRPEPEPAVVGLLESDNPRIDDPLTSICASAIQHIETAQACTDYAQMIRGALVGKGIPVPASFDQSLRTWSSDVATSIESLQRLIDGIKEGTASQEEVNETAAMICRIRFDPLRASLKLAKSFL